MSLWSSLPNKMAVSIHGMTVGLYRHVIAASLGTWPESFIAGVGLHDVLRSEADGLTAAGTTQAGATVLPAVMNRLTTVGASSGVALPIMLPGMVVYVVHDGVSNVLVYPNLGDTGATIDGGASVTLTAGRRGWYACFTAGTIVSGYMLKSA